MDHFQWPKLVAELVARAGADLDAAAHRLVAAARGGQKLVAIGGATRRAGSTTLLLCLAQRLSAMRLKAALVDADFAEPKLAKRLGLSPQFGWQDIRDHERSISEVLVESIDDALTLLPLARSLAATARLTGEICWPASLSALRERYHLTLLDAGPLDGTDEEEPPWLRGDWGIDAAIVVGEPGDEGHRKLSEIVERLYERGIEVAGVVENFCAEETDRLARRHRSRTVSMAEIDESSEVQSAD